jgi:hypothetical protein
MDSLVKVGSFLGVEEAELARIRLAMDGIAARLSNAEMVNWAWYYSNASGGVKVFVNAADAARAALIIAPKPVAQQFQPPKWICPKCQADVDGLWSFCWSCGTSKQGEEDPDFHAWYRKSADVSPAKISNLETIGVIISALYVVFFVAFNFSLLIIIAWLITLVLWVLLYRYLFRDKSDMAGASDLISPREQFSEVHYDPARDEFNPADETAYKLWKAAIFSFGESLIFFPFALWLWYKTRQDALLLTERGRRYYFYSMVFISLTIVVGGWVVFWLCLS